jgi:endo-1,4-beta-xylanase
MIHKKYVLLLVAAILVASLAVTGCSKKAPILKAADKHGLVFGTAITAGDIFDPEMKEFITSHFNLVVPENTMKWVNIRPTKQFWNWSDLDKMVDFAEENDIIIKGHPLIWDEQTPGFVNSVKTKEAALEIIVEHITEIMTRYKGRIQMYDVVNEPFAEDGSMLDSFWYRTCGTEFIDVAFRTAREIDPDAILILNEFNNEFAGHPKSDGMYEFVKGMVERGVPIDGIGIQMHIMAESYFDAEALQANIKRYADLGLSVYFSEIDVRIKNPVTGDNEAQQVAAYRGLMEAALANENAKHFVVWGFADSRSWVPRAFSGYGSAHLFENDVEPRNPKAAFKEIETVLKNWKN